MCFGSIFVRAPWTAACASLTSFSTNIATAPAMHDALTFDTAPTSESSWSMRPMNLPSFCFWWVPAPALSSSSSSSSSSPPAPVVIVVSERRPRGGLRVTPVGSAPPPPPQPPPQQPTGD